MALGLSVAGGLFMQKQSQDPQQDNTSAQEEPAHSADAAADNTQQRGDGDAHLRRCRVLSSRSRVVGGGAVVKNFHQGAGHVIIIAVTCALPGNCNFVHSSSGKHSIEKRLSPTQGMDVYRV